MLLPYRNVCCGPPYSPSPFCCQAADRLWQRAGVTIDLFVEWDSYPIELGVGETFTVRQAYIGCLHTIKWRDIPVSDVRWGNETPEVGSFEDSTRIITALSPGEGVLTASIDYGVHKDIEDRLLYLVVP